MRMYGAEINRLPRRKVLIRAQMRAGGRLAEICIRDISARGMLVQASTPPRRGAIVEILCEGLSIIGQIIWTSDRRFGIQTHDTLDVAAFIDGLSDPEGQSTVLPLAASRIRIGTRRRASHEQSRDLSRALQFVTVVGACGAAAVALAFALHGELTEAVVNASTGL